MEIRKSGSSSALNFVENQKNESDKKPEKSSAQGILSVRDSFELSKNSSSSAQQTQENSGKKQLSAAEEQAAASIEIKDPTDKSASTSTDPQSQLSNAKNSGLVSRLGHDKTQSESKADQARKTFNTSDLKNSQTQNPEQSSSAVNDAQQKLNGGGRNDRQSLEQELAQRRQDYSMLGGVSPMDKVKNSSLDPTAQPKGKNTVPTGKDAVESKVDDVIGLAAAATSVLGPYGVAFGAAILSTHAIDNLTGGVLSDLPDKLSDNLEKKSDLLTDAIQKQQLQKNQDAHDAKRKAKETITVYHEGQSVEPDENHPNGVRYESSDGSDVTPKNNSAKTPDSEHRGGNVPEDIKKSMQYFQDQINKTKPKHGGETQLTDGGVTGNSAVAGGPVNNIITRSGGLGAMVSQPTRATDNAGNASGFSGSSSPINNGGATDPMEGSNYTGRTIEDDPADVHFGPADQPKQQTGSKKSQSSNSSTSIFDLLHKKTVK